MTTRFIRTVEVNGKSQEIELVRDGFNVYVVDFNEPVSFGAHLERVFGMPMWAYQEIEAYDDSVPHRAFFENEADVTDYMSWRVQKWLIAASKEVVTDGTTKS